MKQAWKNDPRLKQMNPEKLNLLLSFAKELDEAPENQKINAFLSINQRAAAKNISFSPAEKELLLSILTDGMAPEELKRVRLIQNLASRLSFGNRK